MELGLPTDFRGCIRQRVERAGLARTGLANQPDERITRHCIEYINTRGEETESKRMGIVVVTPTYTEQKPIAPTREAPMAQDAT